MSPDQQTARVNVSDDDWIEFRTLAMRSRRSSPTTSASSSAANSIDRRSQRIGHPAKSRRDLAGDPRPASA